MSALHVEGVQVIYYIHKSLECLTLCGITLVVEPVESKRPLFKKSSVRDWHLVWQKRAKDTLSVRFCILVGLFYCCKVFLSF